LRSSEAYRKILDMAYLASSEVENGAYDALITDLTLSLEDGTSVTQPETTIPLNVNRNITGAETVSDGKLTVSARDGVLKIRGLETGKAFSVYNMQGALIYSGKATAPEATVNLYARGVYVVVSGNQSIKAVN
jgi:hypothetical protein